MFCLSSSTSSRDSNGHTYSVDLLFYGKRCDNLMVYEGKCFNHKAHCGRHGNLVKAKFRHGGPDKNSKEWIISEVQVAQEADSCGQRFNNMMKHLCRRARVHIMIPQYGRLDKTCVLSPKRKLGEYFLFEDQLDKFRCFVDVEGRVRGKKKDGSRRQSTTQVGVPQPAQDRVEFLSTHQPSNVPSRPLLISECDTLLNNMFYQPQPPTYEESQSQYGFGSPLSTNQCMTECSHWIRPLPSCPTTDLSDLTLAALSTSPSTTQAYTHNYYNNLNNVNDNSNDIYLEGDKPLDVVQAFIHYFFCQSGGQSIIANLKGEYEGDGNFNLTTPTIHSISRSHGERDKGESGIRSVIGHHTCSNLCRHLPDMSSLLEQTLTGHRQVASK